MASTPTTTSGRRDVPSVYDHAIAGQIAGMVGLTLVHPLDTVKSRLQTGCALAQTLDGRRRGAYGVAVNLLRKDGAKGLYRGITAPMMAYGAINAVAFSANAGAKDFLRTTLGAEAAASAPAGALTGAFAGLVSSFVRGPAERLKTVQQVIDCDSGRYRSATSTALTLVKEHGVVRGLFTGTGATIAREIPQCAVYFLTYDKVKSACLRALCGDADAHDAPAAARAGAIVLAGGSAGAFQWLLTYPLDVTKSRIQAAPPHTYSGVIDCAVKSVVKEGPLVLFRGLNMALLRAFPLHASIFASCEAVHAMLARARGIDRSNS
ncbi:mitochondrial carrier domain-containing protein [Ostreococcus tauri]|uniref:Mitochondrial carrier domain-containing protein n=1 Tax=Ostreococcus tauri TaxID=70448 RepID=A0A1Y5HYF4_OSTTA|nr:mitochondrial carrier domain-containing protein [Ostreococcus tauri]